MKAKYLIGLGFIILGVFLLLDQMGVVPFGMIIGDLWPSIIILIGVYLISHSHRSLFSGIVVTSVGVLLQADQLNMLPWGFWNTFWPVLLILIGVLIFMKGKKGHGHGGFPKKQTGENDLNLNSIFGGSSEKVTASNFRGGTGTALFGGIELDLRDCVIAPEGARLDLTAMFGGFQLAVPRNWRVILNGTPFLGGVENKSRLDPDIENPQVIHIDYFVMFGGIEITN